MASSTRAKRRFHNESMEMIIGCFGGLGFLLAMLPPLARGSIGIALLSFGSIAILLYVIINMRWGDSFGRSFIVAFLAAITALCLSYGCVCYFTSYLASQPGLFSFPSPVVKPTPVH